MYVSELIKQGCLEDTKEGYIVKKNFALQDLTDLDKTLIIPENAVVDLTGDCDGIDISYTYDYSGKGPLFASGEKEK